MAPRPVSWHRINHCQVSVAKRWQVAWCLCLLEIFRGPGSSEGRFTHNMPCPCRSPAMPCHWGFRMCLLIWFTQCGHVWFTLAMPHPCHALTMLFFSGPQHSTAVERWPVGWLPACVRFLPATTWSCYQKHTNLRCRWPVWNQTMFVMDEEKSGSSTLQKRQSVTLLD
jgi:hypothetical protein